MTNNEATQTLTFDDCTRETVHATVGRGDKVHVAYRWTYTGAEAYKSGVTVQCGATYRAGGQIVSHTSNEVTCSKCLKG